VYRIENTSYGLKLSFSGTIARPEMEAWSAEVLPACSRAGARFGVLVDMRELKPLQPDVQSLMVQTQAQIKAAGLVRSCVILSSKILTMQFERLAKESGIISFQRYVDASANSDYEAIALEWITKGTGTLASE